MSRWSPLTQMRPWLHRKEFLTRLSQRWPDARLFLQIVRGHWMRAEQLDIDGSRRDPPGRQPPLL